MISPYQKDIMKEVINISIGRAANALHEILNSHVDLNLVELYIYTDSSPMVGFDFDDLDRLSAVTMNFSGDLRGKSALLFPQDSAHNIVNTIIDDVDEDFNSLKAQVLTEVGNIVINNLVGTISNYIESKIVYTLPNYLEDTLKNLREKISFDISHLSIVMLARTQFYIEKIKVTGNIIIIFELESFHDIISAIEEKFFE